MMQRKEFFASVYLLKLYFILKWTTSADPLGEIHSSSAIDLYSPSPYNLEEYCTDAEGVNNFFIDSWKGAIFRLGYMTNPDGTPKSRGIHKCKVKIQTKDDFWLTAAVEHMKIRGSRDSSNRWQCSDYVQFSSPARTVVGKLFSVLNIDLFKSKRSEKLCGEKRLDSTQLEYIFDVSTDANSFSTASKKMTFDFHQDDDDRHRLNNSFIIVVTSFRHASEEVFATNCEGRQKCYGTDIYCIDKNFICDGHINCAFPGSATDEWLCGVHRKPKFFNMTSIIIISLASIVSVGVLICILSTIICRLKARLTNVDRRAASPRLSNVSLSQYPSAPGESVLPPYESAISSDPLHDAKYHAGPEDGPPKYETLFPNDSLIPPPDFKQASEADGGLIDK